VKMLTIVDGFDSVGFLNTLGSVAGVRRQILVLSLGPN
jgi:hypothetical protein